MYQPKTGQKCSCKRGVQRDNCPNCEGTGMVIDFAAIRARRDATKTSFEQEQKNATAAQPTPGPSWYAAKMGNDHQGLIIAENTGANIAVVYDKANAPLIAAAPDLLAALEAFVRDRGTCPTANGLDLEAWDMMKAAIRKARGE